MTLTVNGYVIADLPMAGHLYITGRINKRDYKKLKHYFDLRAKRQPPEDLEAAWDSPGFDNDWSMGKLLDH